MNEQFNELSSYVIGLEETIVNLRKENDKLKEQLKEALGIQSDPRLPMHDNALECQASETVLEDDLMVYEIKG